MTVKRKRNLNLFVQRIHHNYYGTEVYTAAVVTIILILQIYWMTRGTNS